MKQKEFVSGYKLVNKIIVGAEEADSGLSLQKTVLKSPCRTGLPSKLLPSLCSESQKLWKPTAIAMIGKPPALLPAP